MASNAAVRAKIVKPSAQKQEVSDLELHVAQALVDLENNVADLKADLRVLYFNSAREVDVGNGKKGVVIFVPVPLLKSFHKVQSRLVRELEKKFSSQHVLIVASRKIIPVPSRKASHVRKQKRPRSRTLTAVHDAILEDLVYPTEIVGKRIRVRVDGSRVIKCYLDAQDKNSLEYKVDTFSAVYRKLTGKEVVFDFPVVQSD
ncbi:hypothetical protein MP228_000455 [Amoeboaphelidium protococcarum]|nr:hypothetical protein MP228_000455 [Amoeboaphelidium protococcarum]